LDSHVGLIYGDSITIERAKTILSRLENHGFASSNVVFGIGSYTYQYVTRDTFGFAMKCTYTVRNGEGHELFKDPVTDSGTKKSARGLLRVERENGEYVLYDQQTPEQEQMGCLETVFKNGNLVKETTIAEIRERLKHNI
jgi:nicotinamide phosphoribosyltransferase